MSEELELRLLTTIRYVRRQGLELADVERCVELIRQEETIRTADTRMREHRAGVERVRSRFEAEGSE